MAAQSTAPYERPTQAQRNGLRWALREGTRDMSTPREPRDDGDERPARNEAVTENQRPLVDDALEAVHAGHRSEVSGCV